MLKKIHFSTIMLFVFLSLSINAQQIDMKELEGLSADQLERGADILTGAPSPDELDLDEDVGETLVPIREENETEKNIREIRSEIDLINLKRLIKGDASFTDEEKEMLLDSSNENIKFGYNFFDTAPSSIDASSDLPVPNNYKISLNDIFTVILSGSEERIFDLEVKLDGSILFPEIGSISVVGEDFGAIKDKITNIINQSYIGVKVNLSLKEMSAKKITIVGLVNSPGTYLVNPFSTISSSLAYSGGIQEIGSLRNIKIIKSNGVISNFDLYELLIKGDRTNDITIDAGDVILIEPARQFIDLRGAVRRPAIYEMKQNETVEDLIDFGMGFNDDSNQSKIALTKLNLKNSSIDTIEITNLDSNIGDVLSVDVFKYNSNLRSGVTIFGAVEKPGFYSLDELSTLEELINKMNFINVYPSLAILEQFDPITLKNQSVLFNLDDPYTYKSIPLTQNAKVYFLDILKSSEYIDLVFVEELPETTETDTETDTDTDTDTDRDEIPNNFLNYVDYNLNDITRSMINEYALTVNYRGILYRMPVYGSFRVKSFIDILGLDMNNMTLESTSYISPLDNVIEVGNYNIMRFKAGKFHNISFRSPLNTIKYVEIAGEVKYPGMYALNAEATLFDLYELAGGFTDIANTDGIIFRRETVAEIQLRALRKAQDDLNNSILLNNMSSEAGLDPSFISALTVDIDIEDLGRISGNYKPDNMNNVDMILLDGDAITVPTKTNTISVLGEVLNPNTFPYEDISLNQAIVLSGGANDFADLKKVYIIHANGLISRANKNIFSTNRSFELSPGDTIIVPRKIIIEGQILKNITAFSQVISNIAFSAAALQSLNTNNN